MKIAGQRGFHPRKRGPERDLTALYLARDWKFIPKRDDLETSEPVPANWFRRAVFGIRRPTRSREGTLRGAFAASGVRLGSAR